MILILYFTNWDYTISYWFLVLNISSFRLLACIFAMNWLIIYHFNNLQLQQYVTKQLYVRMELEKSLLCKILVTYVPYMYTNTHTVCTVLIFFFGNWRSRNLSNTKLLWYSSINFSTNINPWSLPAYPKVASRSSNAE